MILCLFILGFLIYLLSVYGMYTPAIKNHPWYIPGNMVFGVAVGWVWPLVVKLSPDANTLYFRGMLWDAMLVGCYALLPYFFGVKPPPVVIFGGVIACSGLLIMKLGGG